VAAFLTKFKVFEGCGPQNQFNSKNTFKITTNKWIF